MTTTRPANGSWRSLVGTGWSRTWLLMILSNFAVHLAKTRKAVALGNEIQRVRMVFKYAFDAGLIHKPVRYGPTFKRPSKRVLRKARRREGPEDVGSKGNP